MLGIDIAINTPVIASTTTSSSRLIPAVVPSLLKPHGLGRDGSIRLNGRQRLADRAVRAEFSL
jgi:hypothetical protein